MRTAFVLLAAGLALAGCATTPINVDCKPFRTEYTGAVPRSLTMEEIQSRAKPEGIVASNDRELFQASLERTLGEAFVNDTKSGPVLLALSGGGQWGAFGAAYLAQLDAKSGTRLPQFTAITGVSTGALQALYIGAAQSPKADRAALMEQLTVQYAPKSESEIVNRTSKYLAPFKGSVAKLGPLRRRIEAALCENKPANPETVTHCPLIEQLAQEGAPTVLLGFVETASGQMQYVNVTAIARDAVRPQEGRKPIGMKTAQQCITGGALASVAMPFFYQQVQVTSDPPPNQSGGPLTYYDGGVRQSMFLYETTQVLSQMSARKRAAAKLTSPVAPSIYLVRNGPSIALPAPDANGRLDVLTTAERGYSLIVNQSEITAIEAIRLRDPKAEMRLITADGYDREFGQTDKRPCKKHDTEAMFEPQFMKCLQAYGRYMATSAAAGTEGGWIILTKPR